MEDIMISRSKTLIGQHGHLTDLRYDNSKDWEFYRERWFLGSLKSPLLFAVRPEAIPEFPEGTIDPDFDEVTDYNITY